MCQFRPTFEVCKNTDLCMIDSKRIVKNTAFLYIRLFLVLCVTLYTSRVVLDKLGVDDYGLYNVVYGVVGLLSFLTGTLSIGTSRFITYELGSGDYNKLVSTFKTSLTIHVIISAIVILLGETIGLWYINSIMVCPDDRFVVAGIVFQISIIATVLSLLVIPFTAVIIAHEKMDVYAYIGIFEAIAGLAVAFLISNTHFDRLLYYAVLVLCVKILVTLAYALYSLKAFPEVTFRLGLHKDIFKRLLSFSGYNILANVSNTLMNNGIVMLFNYFFAPVVVAAQSISTQISQALMLFVNNVRQAINPQVIKLYAEGNYKESQQLTLKSTEYLFDILLLFGVPMILVMPRLLDIWLVEVPEYTVIFAQLIVVQNILDIFSISFYTPMVAADKIKTNSWLAAVTCVIQFVILALLFRQGLGPIWARIIGIAFSVLWSFVLKPYILWKEIAYNIKDLLICMYRCIRVLLVVVLSSLTIFYLIPQESVLGSIEVAFLSALAVLVISYLFLGKNARIAIVHYIKARIIKERNEI